MSTNSGDFRVMDFGRMAVVCGGLAVVLLATSRGPGQPMLRSSLCGVLRCCFFDVVETRTLF